MNENRTKYYATAAEEVCYYDLECDFKQRCNCFYLLWLYCMILEHNLSNCSNSVSYSYPSISFEQI